MEAYRRLGELLVDRGIISQLELAAAVRAQTGTGQRLGQVLVDRGTVTDADIANCLAHQFDLDLADPTRIQPDPEALGLFSFEDAWVHTAVPYSFEGESIHLLVADPINVDVTDALSRKTSRRIVLHVASAGLLSEYIEQWYGMKPATKQKADPKSPNKYSNVARRATDEFGTWFVATDLALDRIVTLTSVKQNTAQHDGYLELLRWASQQHHPIVNQIFDTRIHRRRRWTAIETVKGESLERKAQRGITRWGLEVLDPIADLAELLATSPCGYLSPSNVFIRDGEIRIAPVCAVLGCPDHVGIANIVRAAAQCSGSVKNELHDIADAIEDVGPSVSPVNFLRQKAKEAKFGSNTDQEKTALLNFVPEYESPGFGNSLKRMFNRAG